MRDGRLLGMKELGGKLADIPVETMVIDDELKPDAVFAFMKGGSSANLVRLYRQAGLADILFLSAFMVNEATLPAHQAAATGFFNSGAWVARRHSPPVAGDQAQHQGLLAVMVEVGPVDRPPPP